MSNESCCKCGSSDISGPLYNPFYSPLGMNNTLTREALVYTCRRCGYHWGKSTLSDTARKAQEFESFKKQPSDE